MITVLIIQKNFKTIVTGHDSNFKCKTIVVNYSFNYFKKLKTIVTNYDSYGLDLT